MSQTNTYWVIEKSSLFCGWWQDVRCIFPTSELLELDIVASKKRINPKVSLSLDKRGVRSGWKGDCLKLICVDHSSSNLPNRPWSKQIVLHLWLSWCTSIPIEQISSWRQFIIPKKTNHQMKLRETCSKTDQNEQTQQKVGLSRQERKKTIVNHCQ